MVQLTIITILKKITFKAMGSLRELTLIFLSAKHCILLKIYFMRVESLRDYVDGLLSLAYIPNIVVVDSNKYQKRRSKALR